MTRKKRKLKARVPSRAATGSAFTVSHSCGMWQLHRGDELGRGVITTASMGKSISTRYPVGENPRLKDIEARLMQANAAQFEMPNADLRQDADSAASNVK